MLAKHFLDGLEETIARIVSLVLSLTFFGLYFGSKTPVLLDWYSLIGILALFWLVYEAVSYLLYIFFKFFSSSKNGNNENIPSNGNFASNQPEENSEQINSDNL